MSTGSILRGARKVPVHRSASAQTPRGARPNSSGRVATPCTHLGRSLSHESCGSGIEVHRHGRFLHLSEQELQDVGNGGGGDSESISSRCGHYQRCGSYCQRECHLFRRRGTRIPRDESSTRSLSSLCQLYCSFNFRMCRYQKSHCVPTPRRLEEDFTRRHEAPR